MNLFVAGESSIWDSIERPKSAQLSDREINEKYESQEKRIITETNREKLPNFVESLKRPGYLQIRPFYQRRARWSVERQSQLIESFIINVPVPPLFLYEKAYNSYEVMDGQQRISAIKSFYNNEFKLKGLALWPELNGRTYSSLPAKIQAGIDRRSISYIVLLNESADEGEEALFLKQLVFERLNTGGVKLEHQEVRNCLYEGKFNQLILKLSRRPIFAEAWGIPAPSPDEDFRPPEDLVENRKYSEMEDVELVLRFFALRHAANFRRGMQGFLDLYMMQARSFNEEDVSGLETIFDATLGLAHQIYGDKLFRPYDVGAEEWVKSAQKAFYDAVMVGLSQNLFKGNHLITRKDVVIEGTRDLFLSHPEGTFTGRGNTKADVLERIRLFSEMIKRI
jgi:hypothetical protein